MRALIQRVSEASVTIDGAVHATIRHGLLVLLGVESRDTPADIAWLSGKIARLRVFNDDQGLMNLSIHDVRGDILVISQFTLFASTKKGNRPSYTRSAPPDIAVPLYNQFVAHLQLDLGKSVSTGVFGADMKVQLVNDGPVTLLIDSQDKE